MTEPYTSRPAGSAYAPSGLVIHAGRTEVTRFSGNGALFRAAYLAAYLNDIAAGRVIPTPIRQTD